MTIYLPQRRVYPHWGMTMSRMQKDVLLIEIIDRLIQHRNWCGEFHIQKVIYFLQELFDLKTGFTYILYKNSPYSFDLSDELNRLCSRYLIEFDH